MNATCWLQLLAVPALRGGFSQPLPCPSPGYEGSTAGGIRGTTWPSLGCRMLMLRLHTGVQAGSDNPGEALCVREREREAWGLPSDGAPPCCESAVLLLPAAPGRRKLLSRPTVAAARCMVPLMAAPAGALLGACLAG